MRVRRKLTCICVSNQRADQCNTLDGDWEHSRLKSWNLLPCHTPQTKYKLNLRDGVFRVNGREYLFKKATGEWSWV